MTNAWRRVLNPFASAWCLAPVKGAPARPGAATSQARLIEASSLDTRRESARTKHRSSVRYAHLALVAFSDSLPVWAAPIGGTASFIDGCASFGTAAASTAAGWSESALR